MNIANRLSKNGLAIFLFHGVIDGSNYTVRNYTRKHLDKKHFYHLLKSLKRVGYSLSMDDVIEYHNTGKSFPPYAFAITFDDGFENNYSIAAPVLADLKIPATFYITTNFIENNTMSWIDRIEYCLEITPRGSLSFLWDEIMHSFETIQDKIKILTYLRNYVKQDASIDVDGLVSDIFAQCGLDEIKCTNDPLDLKMTWKQVQQLAHNDNFIVGGHTHRHVVLSFLDQDELDVEIKTSIDLLAQKAGIHSPHYSYPEGQAYCYSGKVIDALKKYEIICCPTAIDGVNQVSDDLFHLRRITVT